MSPLPEREGEAVEFKREWTKRALEDLAAFANLRGGTVYVGVDDDGKVFGVSGTDEELQTIANQVAESLGLRPSITWEKHRSKDVLVVHVEAEIAPVALRGRHLTRVGSTNREMTREQLSRSFLRASGKTWDALASDLTVDDVSLRAIRHFTRLAQRRRPEIAEEDSAQRVLENLQLLADGRLTNAAVLLFVENPQRCFTTARIRVGKFRGTTIIGEETLVGTLWEQLDGTTATIRHFIDVRYEIKPKDLTVEEFQRKETWDFPEKAIREAVLNSLMHRDYMAPGDAQIRVSKEQLKIWNPGKLMSEIPLEDLKKDGHSSVLRNPLIARCFHAADLVEQWGTGTTNMVTWCQEANLPEPEYIEWSGGFEVRFSSDLFSAERLAAAGLDENQVAIVLYAKEHGRVTNSLVQELTGASKPTATRHLEDLVKRGLLVRRGQKRGTHYVLNRS